MKTALLQPHSVNDALAAQLKKLGAMKDGWLEGAGKAVDKNLLAWVCDRLLATFPEDLAFPFVCPTPTGGIFLEWTLGDWMVSAEFAEANGNCELQAVNTKTSETVDQDLAVDSARSFLPVYAFIRRFA